jgi:hypothetical protein
LELHRLHPHLAILVALDMGKRGLTVQVILPEKFGKTGKGKGKGSGLRSPRTPQFTQFLAGPCQKAVYEKVLQEIEAGSTRELSTVVREVLDKHDASEGQRRASIQFLQRCLRTTHEEALAVERGRAEVKTAVGRGGRDAGASEDLRNKLGRNRAAAAAAGQAKTDVKAEASADASAAGASTDTNPGANTGANMSADVTDASASGEAGAELEPTDTFLKQFG